MTTANSSISYTRPPPPSLSLQSIVLLQIQVSHSSSDVLIPAETGRSTAFYISLLVSVARFSLVIAVMAFSKNVQTILKLYFDSIVDRLPRIQLIPHFLATFPLQLLCSKIELSSDNPFQQLSVSFCAFIYCVQGPYC